MGTITIDGFKAPKLTKDQDIRDRMVVACHDCRCRWGCEECIFDHCHITPEREAAFLKWEKGEHD